MYLNVHIWKPVWIGEERDLVTEAPFSSYRFELIRHYGRRISWRIAQSSIQLPQHSHTQPLQRSSQRSRILMLTFTALWLNYGAFCMRLAVSERRQAGAGFRVEFCRESHALWDWVHPTPNWAGERLGEKCGLIGNCTELFACTQFFFLIYQLGCTEIQRCLRKMSDISLDFLDKLVAKILQAIIQKVS